MHKLKKGDLVRHYRLLMGHSGPYCTTPKIYRVYDKFRDGDYLYLLERGNVITSDVFDRSELQLLKRGK